MLEPDAVKVASPVLRGLGTGNGSWLLGKVASTVLRREGMSNHSFLFERASKHKKESIKQDI